MKTQNNGLILPESDFHRLSSLAAAARTELGELLEEELSRARVVADTELPTDVVTMNSQVRFRDVDAGKESAITLVYPPDADVDANKISILTPLGTALIGLRVGQTIRWPFPHGKQKEIQIVSVQPGLAAEATSR